MDIAFETPSGDIKKIKLTPQANGSYAALIGEQNLQVEVQFLAAGGMRLTVNGIPYHVHTAQDGTTHFVAVSGRTLRLEKTSTGAVRAGSRAHAGDLTASMPGQVVDVLVAEGERVTKGQTLALLEAMKMEMRVKSPCDGVVKQVLCAKGDAVERGQLLVEVEEQD